MEVAPAEAALGEAWAVGSECAAELKDDAQLPATPARQSELT